MTFGSNRAFWFEKTAAGYPFIVKPDGSRSHSFRRNAPEGLSTSQQSIDGWRRAMLYKEEFEIEDPMSFGAFVSASFCCKFGWEDSLLFSSCQAAEENIYPYLSEDKVEECRKNVEAFYSDKNLQASWTPLILHPVCLKFNKNTDNFIPVQISELGDSFLSLNASEFFTCSSLNNLKNDEALRELLYKDRDFGEDNF